ncbi:MAG TPA: hypothetical protein VKA46_04425, partial [Gemmataceae bacterium]|nr:hypothetical protein [Gemmataceae bacterium]
GKDQLPMTVAGMSGSGVMMGSLRLSGIPAQMGPLGRRRSESLRPGLVVQVKRPAARAAPAANLPPQPPGRFRPAPHQPQQLRHRPADTAT